MIDFERDTALTQKMLDTLDMRAQAALQNIANQNTPGYKRQVVKFEELLRDAMEDGKPVASVGPVLERDESGAPGQNNVALVDEVALLDKTKLLQEFVTRRAGGYFGRMNKAILGR